MNFQKFKFFTLIASLFFTAVVKAQPTHQHLLQLLSTLEAVSEPVTVGLLPPPFKSFQLLREFRGDGSSYEGMRAVRTVSLIDHESKLIVFAIFEPFSNYNFRPGYFSRGTPTIEDVIKSPSRSFSSDENRLRDAHDDKRRALNQAIGEVRREYFEILRLINTSLLPQDQAGCCTRSLRSVGLVADPNCQCPNGYKLLITGYSVSGFIAQILAGTAGQEAVVFASPATGDFRNHYKILNYDWFGYPIKEGFGVQNYIRKGDLARTGNEGRTVPLPDVEWGPSLRAELRKFIRDKEKKYREDIEQYRIDLEAFELNQRAKEDKRKEDYKNSWTITKILVGMGSSVFDFFKAPSLPKNPDYRKNGRFDFAKAARDFYGEDEYATRNHDIHLLRSDVDQMLRTDQVQFDEDDLNIPSSSAYDEDSSGSQQQGPQDFKSEKGPEYESGPMPSNEKSEEPEADSETPPELRYVSSVLANYTHQTLSALTASDARQLLCAVLQISVQASREEVGKKVRRTYLKVHPDKNLDQHKVLATNVFKKFSILVERFKD